MKRGKRYREQYAKVDREHEYPPGERVKVVDGPFTDFIGVVDTINAERGKVRVLVSFFGRETPVELDFLQVSRIT